jgi:secreted trypsin-like serine protease
MLGRIKSLLCAATLAAASATPAFAITDGGLDGNAHPYVGLMVARDAAGNGWRCSGTLLSPTIYLTAGHCTEGAVKVDIWFDADVQSGIPGNGYPNNGPYKGVAFTHPQYNPNAFFLFDLGVVVLNGSGVTGLSQYGALPGLNVLDALATRRGQQNQTFTAVGYGLQEINPVFVEAERVRMFATPHLIMINVPGFTGDFSILLSNNHSTGGTCFGDSGGPNFIGSSNVIGGVTSFGINGNCAGTGGVYRVDRADDLDWIATFF